MNQFTMFVISYVGVMFLTLFLVSRLQGGFFFKWLIVKMSRGKKVLLHCYDRQGVYYATAKLLDTMIVFKTPGSDGKKEAKEMIVPVGSVYRSVSVNNLDIDVINWAFFTRENKHIAGVDVPSMANIHERALMKFNLNAMQDKIVLILLILILILLAFAVFKITGLPKVITSVCSTISAGNI